MPLTVTPTDIRVNVSSSGDTTLVAAVASQSTKVYRVSLVTAGAVTLPLQRNVTLSTTNAYPGACFRIKREASGLVNKLVIDGLLGGTIGTLGLNSWADFEFIGGGTGWIQTASGGLL